MLARLFAKFENPFGGGLTHFHGTDSLVFDFVETFVGGGGKGGLIPFIESGCIGGRERGLGGSHGLVVSGDKSTGVI